MVIKFKMLLKQSLGSILYQMFSLTVNMSVAMMTAMKKDRVGS